MKKKSLIGLRIILALIFCGVIGGLYVNVGAYDSYNTTTWDQTEEMQRIQSRRSSELYGLEVVKTSEWVNDNKTEARVTIEVSADAKVTKLPYFIFMVDHSISLNYGEGVNKAIEEARTFLSNNPGSKIAVVNFAGNAEAKPFTDVIGYVESYITNVDYNALDKNRTNFTEALNVLQSQLLQGLGDDVQPIVIWYTDGAPVYPLPNNTDNNNGVMYPNDGVERYNEYLNKNVDYYKVGAERNPGDTRLDLAVENLIGFNNAKYSVLNTGVKMYINLLDINGSGGSLYNADLGLWLPKVEAIRAMWSDVASADNMTIQQIFEECCEKANVGITIDDVINYDLFRFIPGSAIPTAGNCSYSSATNTIQWKIPVYEKKSQISFSLELIDKTKDGWLNTNYIPDMSGGKYFYYYDNKCVTTARYTVGWGAQAEEVKKVSVSTGSPWLLRSTPVEKKAEIVKTARWLDEKECTKARIRIELRSSATRQGGQEVTNIPIQATVSDIINHDLFRIDRSIQDIKSNINTTKFDYGVILEESENRYKWVVSDINYGQKIESEWPYIEFTIVLKDKYNNYGGDLNTNYIPGIVHDGNEKDDFPGDNAAQLIIDGKVVDEEKSPWLHRDPPVETDVKIHKTAGWVNNDNVTKDTQARIRIELESSAFTYEGINKKIITDKPLKATVTDIINYDMFDYNADIQNIKTNIGSDRDVTYDASKKMYKWSVSGVNYGEKVENEWPYVEFTIVLKDEFKDYEGSLNTNYIEGITHDGTEIYDSLNDDSCQAKVGDDVYTHKSPWIKRNAPKKGTVTVNYYYDDGRGNRFPIVDKEEYTLNLNEPKVFKNRIDGVFEYFEYEGYYLEERTNFTLE